MQSHYCTPTKDVCVASTREIRVEQYFCIVKTLEIVVCRDLVWNIVLVML